MIETSATYFPALKRRMAAAGVRPADLARALGHKHQALVGRWLAGQVKARAETLQAVEMAFQGLTATEGLPEPTPPEIGAPGGHYGGHGRPIRGRRGLVESRMDYLDW